MQDMMTQLQSKREHYLCDAGDPRVPGRTELTACETFATRLGR
jgi:hypothetical protein